MKFILMKKIAKMYEIPLVAVKNAISEVVGWSKLTSIVNNIQYNMNILVYMAA